MTTGASTPTRSVRPRRSHRRGLTALGVAVWLVLEIWLLTLVGEAAGGLAVFLLLIAGVVLGAVIIKRAGRRAFENLARTLQAQQRGEMPEDGRRSDGNGLLMLAGLLLMIPGPVSDGVGLLLLVPSVRRTASRTMERALERRMRAAAPGSAGAAYERARMRQQDGKVVQGEVVRDDEPPTDRGDDEGPRPPLTR